MYVVMSRRGVHLIDGSCSFIANRRHATMRARRMRLEFWKRQMSFPELRDIPNIRSETSDDLRKK